MALKHSKNSTIILLALVLAGALLAQTSGPESIKFAFQQFCQLMLSLLPVVVLMMILAAAVIYAIGQLLGAETRARASVWATAMLTGAIIAVILTVVMPWALQNLYPEGNFTTACGTPST